MYQMPEVCPEEWSRLELSRTYIEASSRETNRKHLFNGGSYSNILNNKTIEKESRVHVQNCQNFRFITKTLIYVMYLGMNYR